MPRCDICQKEDPCKFIVTTLSMKLNLCGECMNDFGNHRYDELIAKLKESG